MGMQTELLELLGVHKRRSCALLLLLKLLSIVICVGAEDSDLDLACRHRHLGIDDSGEGGILQHLLELLCFHINT